MAPLAQRQGVTLTIDSGAERLNALADAERIGQVVINLVHNAVKFTPPGGSIFVSTERRPDGIAVSVRDTGVGIAAEALPRLFERFYKADKARVAGRGTGLGLAIAKHLVQGHNGRIWAESAGEGRGSTFTFVLPGVAVNTREPEPDSGRDLEIEANSEAARLEETSVRAAR
jgi:two-component system phosphate regulon sensor histidine kinase PhoR